MALSTGQKIGIGAAGLVSAALLAWKFVVPNVAKLKNLKQNINVESSFKKVHGLIKPAGQSVRVLRLIFNFAITNFSGFNLSIENLFITLQKSSDKGATWSTVGQSPERVAKLTINDGKTVGSDIKIDFRPTTLLAALNINANIYRLVTSYDFKGVQQKEITPINIKEKISSLQTLILQSLGSAEQASQNTEKFNIKLLM